MNSTVARVGALTLLALGTWASPALANLSVHPMRLPIQDKRGGQIRVYSQTPRVQYVQVKVQKVLHPATPQEEQVDVAPGLLEGIAVTPGKFVLGGGGNRLVRVIPLASVSEETAYRVYFEGVRPPSEMGTEEEPETATANVGVSLVWGALVHLIPPQPVPDMRIEGRDLVNIGNVRLGVTTIQACTAGKECADHTLDHSVYPGERVALPFDPTAQRLTVTYKLSYAGYRDHQRVLAP